MTTLTGKVKNYPAVITIVEDLIVVGHNVFTVIIVRTHREVPPPQDTVDRLDVLAAETIRTLLSAAYSH